MKKCLAVILCFLFLLENPAEAAIIESNNNESKAENYIAIAAEKCDERTNEETGTNEETDIKGGKQEEIKAKNGDSNTENQESKDQYSPEDIDLLARLVNAEAKGEPYKGKIAVAATILNRVKDPRYPDTIPGVIYQYNHGFQYCPVRNWEIRRPANEDAYRAVEAALEGEDPTGGALSFFNPAKSFNRWIRSRTYLTKIGNHIFVK
ncbi:MAG: hypothetical protein GX244_06480 [Firmicutes bacterium]|nr:hypothetical protein [Bacillota bacterium]